MLSSVLHSKQAVRVDIEIVRAFVRLGAMAASYTMLARKVDALERSTMRSSRASSTPSGCSWNPRRSAPASHWLSHVASGSEGWLMRTMGRIEARIFQSSGSTLASLQVARGEAFGERRVDRGEEGARLGSLALVAREGARLVAARSSSERAPARGRWRGRGDRGRLADACLDFERFPRRALALRRIWTSRPRRGAGIRIGGADVAGAIAIGTAKGSVRFPQRTELPDVEGCVPFGDVINASSVLLHPFLPVVELGDVRVVLAAHQADVVGIVRTAAAVGLAMVKLEAAVLGATTAAAQRERALVTVALAHTPSYRRRQIARAR